MDEYLARWGSLPDQRAAGALVTEPMTLQRGDAAAALRKAPRRLKGRMSVGGQEHFYLEGQIALAIPGEDDEVKVISSTQHPTEIQTMVAAALGVPANAVTTEVRRMGGAFGGKETQGNLFAVVVLTGAYSFLMASVMIVLARLVVRPRKPTATTAKTMARMATLTAMAKRLFWRMVRLTNPSWSYPQAGLSAMSSSSRSDSEDDE